jgi:hypothetical protein
VHGSMRDMYITGAINQVCFTVLTSIGVKAVSHNQPHASRDGRTELGLPAAFMNTKAKRTCQSTKQGYCFQRSVSYYWRLWRGTIVRRTWTQITSPRGTESRLYLRRQKRHIRYPF